MTAAPSAVLREALHAGPSSEAWAAVCASLDACTDPKRLDELIHLTDKLSASWPGALRVAPIAWWLDLLEGRAQPRFRLVRSLVLTPETRPHGVDLAAALADHAATRQIAHLALPGLELGDDAVARIVGSPRVVQLVALDLARTALGALGVRALARTKHLGALRSLDLSGNEVEPPALEALLGAPGLGKIEALALCDTELGLDGARVLALHAGAARLGDLDLTRAGLGDRGAAALAASPHLARLHRLRLSGNSIGPLGTRALARGLGGAVELDLSANHIDDAAAIELANSPLFDRLLVLDLSDNPLGPAGREALAARAAETSTCLVLTAR